MFTSRIIKNGSVLVLGGSKGQQNARLVKFNKDHAWQHVYASDEGFLVLVDSLKHMYVAPWSVETNELNLGQFVVLPKSVSHTYSENGRLFLFDRAGDIYSQSFSELRQAAEKNENKEEILRDLVLETSEFCAFVSVARGRVNGHEVVAVSDQYYKIRLIDKGEFHRLLMSTSLRTRYAENLLIYKETRLLVYYDDGKMQLLDENEIERSLNVDTNYVCHPFVGKLEMWNVPESDLVLVHCADSHEVHLCEVRVPDLRIVSLDRVKFDSSVLLHLSHHSVIVVPYTPPAEQEENGEDSAEGTQETTTNPVSSYDILCSSSPVQSSVISIDSTHRKLSLSPAANTI